MKKFYIGISMLVCLVGCGNDLDSTYSEQVGRVSLWEDTDIQGNITVKIIESNESIFVAGDFKIQEDVNTSTGYVEVNADLTDIIDIYPEYINFTDDEFNTKLYLTSDDMRITDVNTFALFVSFMMEVPMIATDIPLDYIIWDMDEQSILIDFNPAVYYWLSTDLELATVVETMLFYVSAQEFISEATFQDYINLTKEDNSFASNISKEQIISMGQEIKDLFGNTEEMLNIMGIEYDEEILDLLTKAQEAGIELGFEEFVQKVDYIMEAWAKFEDASINYNVKFLEDEVNTQIEIYISVEDKEMIFEIDLNQKNSIIGEILPPEDEIIMTLEEAYPYFFQHMENSLLAK